MRVHGREDTPARTGGVSRMRAVAKRDGGEGALQRAHAQCGRRP